MYNMYKNIARYSTEKIVILTNFITYYMYNMKIVNVYSNSGKNFMIIDSNLNPVEDVTYYLK
ncbi:hypothetical protein BU090_11830, partial [Staphylococcus warneri]|uniref:hypothetical protein n=1 Tax=Staphylococcus warneri TaxID=1292 RepID=UPI000D4AB7A0